ncbi:hypothetical protein GQ42DRAFT_161416 [Ramicandelaber brevisporus]|nr:hypothetical protein GQ42DRAFT_161416 [Ramicandelaber brevisporus]
MLTNAATAVPVVAVHTPAPVPATSSGGAAGATGAAAAGSGVVVYSSHVQPSSGLATSSASTSATSHPANSTKSRSISVQQQQHQQQQQQQQQQQAVGIEGSNTAIVMLTQSRQAWTHNVFPPADVDDSSSTSTRTATVAPASPLPFAAVADPPKSSSTFLGTCDMMVGSQSFPGTSFFLCRPSTSSTPPHSADTHNKPSGTASAMNGTPPLSAGLGSPGKRGGVGNIGRDASQRYIAFAFKDTPNRMLRFPRECLVEPTNVNAPFRLSAVFNLSGLTGLATPQYTPIFLHNVSQVLCDALLTNTYDPSMALITATPPVAAAVTAVKAAAAAAAVVAVASAVSSASAAGMASASAAAPASGVSVSKPSRSHHDLWLASEMPQSLINDINMHRQLALTPASSAVHSSVPVPLTSVYATTFKTAAMADEQISPAGSPTRPGMPKASGEAPDDASTAVVAKKSRRHYSDAAILRRREAPHSRYTQPQQYHQRDDAGGDHDGYKHSAEPATTNSVRRTATTSSTSSSNSKQIVAGAVAGGNVPNSVAASTSLTSPSASSAGLSAQAIANSNKRCEYCGSRSTPMWRRGPAGAGTLCNACGVKWKNGKILHGVTTTAAGSTGYPGLGSSSDLSPTSPSGPRSMVSPKMKGGGSANSINSVINNNIKPQQQQQQQQQQQTKPTKEDGAETDNAVTSPLKRRRVGTKTDSEM